MNSETVWRKGNRLLNKTQLPKWNQSTHLSTAWCTEYQVYRCEVVLVWKYCIKRNNWSLLPANKNTRNTLSFAFKCTKDGKFRVLFLVTIQHNHDGQLSHRNGERAMFGCFLFILFPLHLMEEVCLLKKAGSQLKEHGDLSCTYPEAHKQTYSCSLASLHGFLPCLSFVS